MVSSESKRLCQALPQAVKKTLEAKFNEISLFQDRSLIKIT